MIEIPLDDGQALLIHQELLIIIKWPILLINGI